MDLNILPIYIAVFIELFITIHMSAFVFWPLSAIYSPDDMSKMFITLFVIRAVFLIICDFFITTLVAVLDFFMVFIGAFIIVPICAMKNHVTLDEVLNIGNNRKNNLKYENSIDKHINANNDIDEWDNEETFDNPVIQSKKNNNNNNDGNDVIKFK